MQVLFCGIVKLSIYTTWDHLWCPTKSMIRERVNENFARSWCAKMLQNWTIWKKKSNMWMSGCLSYIDIVSGTLYTIYCHWLCDIWVMISKFYGWKWIVPMDHGYRVHLPCRIASKFTCWKRSNAVDHCCDFSKPQPAKGSVDSWRVGGYVWKPISNALIWVDVLILLEMICKTTNVRDKMVRIIKQIETLHIFLVNFLLL